MSLDGLNPDILSPERYTSELHREINDLNVECDAAHRRAEAAEAEQERLRAKVAAFEGLVQQGVEVVEAAKSLAAMVTPLANRAWLGDWVLDRAKEVCARGDTDEWTEEVLTCAERLGVGNVQRVAYDPAKHGEVDAEPGQLVWWWGVGDPADSAPVAANPTAS